MGLHKQLEEKSKKFVKFKKQLEGLTDRDGDEYRRIEREICEEYDRYERDEKIQEIRARHKWLQTKLEVVKKRVVDYDQGESIRSATLNLPSTPAGQQQQHQRAHDDITVM